MTTANDKQSVTSYLRLTITYRTTSLVFEKLRTWH